MSSSLAVLNVANVTSSGYEAGSTNVPANVIDGNPNTRWSSLGKGQWIQARLDNQYNVSEVKIAWYMGDKRKSSFVVSTSNDGSTFTNAYSGQSSGNSLSLATYSFSPVNCTYVRITVNGNTQNDWASITEVQIMGTTTTTGTTPTPGPAPAPTPTPAAGGLDVNGVKMIYPSAAGGPSYFYKMSDNIESSKYITTDRNAPTQKTEGNITFQRLAANTVTYASGAPSGKTCRVNINGGGFISTQAHTWKDSPSYIWTPNDSKNCEITYYFRPMNLVNPHTSCATKMRGGIHTSSNDPRASTFEMAFFINGGESSKCESAIEYNHPTYHFSNTTVHGPNNSKANTWMARKTIVWTGKDGKVHCEDWIDWQPFDSSGKPVNNWSLLQTQTFVGDSTYNKIPTWGGMAVYRQDGFAEVDIAIMSIREIIPPT